MKIISIYGVYAESGRRVSRLPERVFFGWLVSGRSQLLRIACNDVAKGDLLAGIS